MTSTPQAQGVSLENKIIVAILAHQSARNKRERAEAWARLEALRKQQAESRTAHG